MGAVAWTLTSRVPAAAWSASDAMSLTAWVGGTLVNTRKPRMVMPL